MPTLEAEDDKAPTPLLLLTTTTRLLHVLQHDDADDSLKSKKDTQEDFYKELERVQNLPQLINAALEDIWNWRHRQEEGETKKQKLQRHDMLERQREILQQKQQEEEEEDLESLDMDNEKNEDTLMKQQSMTESRENDDEDLEEETLEKGLSAEEEEKEEEEENTEAEGDPWKRTLRTFHSLQILTPILIKMLRHSRRDDINIRRGKRTTIVAKKQNDPPGVWLFGDRVFDVCKKQQAERLWGRLADLYIFLGVAREVFDQTQDLDALICICRQQVEKTVAQAHAMKESEAGSFPVCPLPFDGLEKAEVMYKHSDQLDEQYDLTKPLTEAEQYQLYQISTKNLHSYVERILKRRYPKCRLSLYGSCLSDLSLGKAADVDLSLCIPEMEEAKRKFEAGTMSAKAFQKSVKSKVFEVSNLLERNKNDFTNIQPVHRARVPVIKGTYTSAENPYSLGGALDFDVCFLNDIAVANSGLLRQYSLVDPRIKQLMIAVKRWAKDNGLSSTQDKFLSSYTWMNMVVYYVLRLGLAPNLQSEELAKKVGFEKDMNNAWHCVNNLDTFYLNWDDVSSFWNAPERLEHLSVSSLLYGFFRFYTDDFPMAISVVSIKRVDKPFTKWDGFHRLSMFLSIEDPFETHDSHMPHDLGYHAGADEASIIVKRFRQVKEHLYQIIVDGQSCEECIWPAAILPTKAKASTGGPKKGGKRDRKTNQQKRGNKKQENDAQSAEVANARKGKTKNLVQPNHRGDRTPKKPNGSEQQSATKASHGNDNPENSGRRGRRNNQRAVKSQNTKSAESNKSKKDVGGAAGATACQLKDSEPVGTVNGQIADLEQNRPSDGRRAGRNRTKGGNGKNTKSAETGTHSKNIGKNKQQETNRRGRGGRTRKDGAIAEEDQKSTIQDPSRVGDIDDKSAPVESAVTKPKDRNR